MKNYTPAERFSIALWLFGMSALAIIGGAIVMKASYLIFGYNFPPA